jgi:hypothetical protein
VVPRESKQECEWPRSGWPFGYRRGNRWGARLSCHTFRHTALRLQLHALACNLANLMRTLALPNEVEHWSLTTLRQKLVKIGARIVRHGRDRKPPNDTATWSANLRSRLWASRAGPGRRTLASCGRPTHDWRSGAGNRGIPEGAP